MSATVDELTISYEEDGVELVKELDKVVLSKGAWTTILFRYQKPIFLYLKRHWQLRSAS